MRAVLKAALHESDNDLHVTRLVGIVSCSPEYTNRRAKCLWPGPNSRLDLCTSSTQACKVTREEEWLFVVEGWKDLVLLRHWRCLPPLSLQLCACLT
jgi:hypothetical protein